MKLFAAAAALTNAHRAPHAACLIATSMLLTVADGDNGHWRAGQHRGGAGRIDAVCPFMAGYPALNAGGPGASSVSCPSAGSLRRWQGLKFGIMVHWGPYSQIGVDASWPLNWNTLCQFGNPTLCAPKPCSECTHADLDAYRRMYWGLSKTFNPAKFNASAWADAAAGAGMKYFVMTTKHHDGFAMYNTSAQGAPGQPVYGVTGPDCPAQRDLFGEAAAAMRERGLQVGAYYSKADWHAHSFWSPPFGFPTTPNVNYNITENQSLYGQFVAFDKQQLDEIQKRYNPDILWLDADWVGPGQEPQTLPIAAWATAARAECPAQLWVNRHSPNSSVAEDYLTPEAPPPDEVLSIGLGLWPKPWEVCMTLGNKWAYLKNDTYKPASAIVRTLTAVASTGGSLLLDVGPMPTGELPPTALERLAAVGRWMAVNGDAVHGTVPVFPYAVNVTVDTTGGGGGVARKALEWRLSRGGEVVFAMLLLENDSRALPVLPALDLPFAVNAAGGISGSWPAGPLASVRLLGGPPVPFAWSDDRGLVLTPPAGLASPEPTAAVFALDFSR